jgi:hypothetical protein
MLMMKHMLEIEDALQKKEAEELAKENQDMLEKCKHELQAFRAINDPVAFLMHLSENYFSYKNMKINFKEDDYKYENMKKTLLKCTLHYHPDKKKTLVNWSELFDEK